MPTDISSLKLDRAKPIAAKELATFLGSVPKSLKVEASAIPPDYLAFLQQSNGFYNDELGQLDPAGKCLKLGKEYLFDVRGWLYIGTNLAGEGYAIDLTAKPPAYLRASFITLTPIFLGHTFDEFLNSLVTGDCPPAPGQTATPQAGTQTAGVVAEYKRRGEELLAVKDFRGLLAARSKPLLVEFDLASRKVVQEFGPFGSAAGGAFVDFQGCFGCAACSPDGRTLAVLLDLQPHLLRRYSAVVLYERATGKALWRTDCGSLDDGKFKSPGFLTFTPDGSEILFQSPGSPLRFLNVADGAITRSIDLPTDYDGSGCSNSLDRPLAISPDGRLLALANYPRFTPPMLRVYDMQGTLLASVPCDAYSLSWSPDGRHIIVCGHTPGVFLFDTSCKVVRYFALNFHRLVERNATYYGSRCFVTQDNRLVALDADGLRLWDLNTGDSLGLLACTADALVHVDPPGTTALTWDHIACTFRTYRLPGGDVPPIPRMLPTPDPTATSTHMLMLIPAMRDRALAMQATGDTLVAKTEHAFYVWNTADWTIRHEIAGAEIPGLLNRGLSLSADGRVALSISRGHVEYKNNAWEIVDSQRHATLYDTAAGKIIARWPDQASRPFAGAVSPDGSFAVLALDDGTLARWECASGAILSHLTPPAKPRCLAFTADGRQVALGGDAGMAFYDAAAAAPAFEIPGKQGPIDAIHFSPDGKLALTHHPVPMQNHPVAALYDLAKRKQIRVYKPICTRLDQCVWLPGNEEFYLVSATDSRAYRFGIAAPKRLEALDTASAQSCPMALVRDQFLVTAGLARTHALAVWQYVPNSSPSKRVPDE